MRLTFLCTACAVCRIFDPSLRDSVTTHFAADFMWPCVKANTRLIVDISILSCRPSLGFTHLAVCNGEDRSLVATGTHTKLFTAPIINDGSSIPISYGDSSYVLVERTHGRPRLSKAIHPSNNLESRGRGRGVASFSKV